jgi:hypothetical protein
MADSDDVWRRVETNKRIAQRSLTQHEPHYPEYYKLPEADWYHAQEPVGLLPDGSPFICGARARFQQIPAGYVGFYDYQGVTCRRPRHHPRDHVSSCNKIMFIRRWKVVCWPAAP